MENNPSNTAFCTFLGMIDPRLLLITWCTDKHVQRIHIWDEKGQIEMYINSCIYCQYFLLIFLKKSTAIIQAQDTLPEFATVGSRPRLAGIDIAALKFSTLSSVLKIATCNSKELYDTKLILYWRHWHWMNRKPVRRVEQVGALIHKFAVLMVKQHHSALSPISKPNYVHPEHQCSFL